MINCVNVDSFVASLAKAFPVHGKPRNEAFRAISVKANKNPEEFHRRLPHMHGWDQQTYTRYGRPFSPLMLRWHVTCFPYIFVGDVWITTANER